MTNLATGPAIQQAPGAASNVIYVPRNVYVPVIKPVFVPRERKLLIIAIKRKEIISHFLFER